MRSHKLLIVFAALACLGILIGCSSEEATQQFTAEERYKLGMAHFQNEDYLEAIEEFKVVTLQFSGTQWADDAQYYMAECRYLRGEYILGAYEYDVLIRTMPTSPFVRLARFRKATCYYLSSPSTSLDQVNTRKAIDDYQSFIEYHSTDSLATVAETRIAELNAKLAEKEYNSGIIYLKMDYYKAATYYFDLVLEKYHDTPFAEPASVRKVDALIHRKRYDEAITEIGRFLERHPASALKDEAMRLRGEAERLKASVPSDTVRTQRSER